MDNVESDNGVVPIYLKVENDTPVSRVSDIMKLSMNNGHGMWSLENGKQLQLINQPPPNDKCFCVTINVQDPATISIRAPTGSIVEYNLAETFYYLRIPLNYNQLVQPFRGLHKQDQISVSKETPLTRALYGKDLQVVYLNLAHQQQKYRILTDLDTFQDMCEAIMCENMIIFIGEYDPDQLRYGSYVYIPSSKSLDEIVQRITEVIAADEWKQALAYIRISKMDLLNNSNIFVTIAEEVNILSSDNTTYV